MAAEKTNWADAADEADKLASEVESKTTLEEEGVYLGDIYIIYTILCKIRISSLNYSIVKYYAVYI